VGPDYRKAVSEPGMRIACAVVGRSHQARRTRAAGNKDGCISSPLSPTVVEISGVFAKPSKTKPPC